MSQPLFKIPGVRDVLEKDPIVLVDVGARAGIHHRWAGLGKTLKVIAFEPDPVECERLNAEGNGQLFIPTALSDSKGTKKLLLTKNPGCSSILEPHHDLLKRFPDSDRFSVIREIAVPVETLDNAAQTYHFSPDVIKIDVQGADFAVLKGGMNALKSSLFAIEIEVEFMELYKGQPLFSHIDSFLKSQGFTLFDLKRCRWKRQAGETLKNYHGQLVFADALYFRDVPAMPGSNTLSTASLVKAIALSLIYEKFDYALELLEYAGTIKVIPPDLTEEIRGILLGFRRPLQWLPNFKGRFGLAKKMRQWADIIAPQSWGPSDTSW